MNSNRNLKEGDFVFGIARGKIAKIISASRAFSGELEVRYSLPPDSIAKLMLLNNAQLQHLKLIPLRRELKLYTTTELQPWVEAHKGDIDALLSVGRIVAERRVNRVSTELLRRIEAYLTNIEMIAPARPSASRRKTWAEMDNKVLVANWQRSIAILADPNKTAEHERAESVLEAIGEEWAKRGERARSRLFEWPTTDAPRGNASLLGLIGPEQGMLGHIGFRVGIYGIRNHEERRVFLDWVLQTPLPPMISAEYMDSWAEPGSVQRLQKLAYSLAAFTRNAKRNPKGSELAIEHWERDLRYLYEHHYRPIRDWQFYWPET